MKNISTKAKQEEKDNIILISDIKRKEQENKEGAKITTKNNIIKILLIYQLIS
jgi:hypothetical protein